MSLLPIKKGRQNQNRTEKGPDLDFFTVLRKGFGYLMVSLIRSLEIKTM